MAVADGREVAAAAGGRTVSTKAPLELVLSVCKVAAMTVRQRGEYTADENEVGAMAARAGREAHAAAVAPSAFIESFLVFGPIGPDRELKL